MGESEKLEKEEKIEETEKREEGKEEDKSQEERREQEKAEKENYTQESLREKVDKLRGGMEETEEGRFINEVLSSLMGNSRFSGNLVIANTISESSFFKSPTESKGAEEKIYCLTEPGELHKFMEQKKDSMLKLYLLVLAGVRIVEKNELDSQALILASYLDTGEEKAFSGDRELPLSSITEQLNAREYVIEKNTPAGKTKAEAIGYTEEQAAKIRNILWKEYLFLRRPMTEWLLQVSKQSGFSASFLASEGLAKLCALDFSYAQDQVLNVLEKGKSIREIGCLAEILLEIAKHPGTQNYAVHLVKNWTRRNYSNAWLAGLTCYVREPSTADARILHERLCTTLTGENPYGQKTVIWYLGTLLHNNSVFGEMLYDAIAEAFSDADFEENKERISLNVLSLMLEEIYRAGKRTPKLVLIDLLNEDSIRKKALSMWRHVWKNYELRHLTQDLLDYYFEKISTTGEYMKLFFRMLAYTRVKADFDNTIIYLEHPGAGRKTREFLKNWLLELKKTRR